MKKSLLVFLLISIAMGVIMYIASDNIFIALGVLMIFLFTSILLMSPMISRYEKVCQRYHENFHFINNFIISLSIKRSISGALESTSLSMNDEFLKMYQGLEDMTENEKLDYLSSYFPFYSYLLFLQIIKLWQEEGGDILAMSTYLLNETRSEEEYVSATSKMGRKKYIEVGSLWMICLLILILLRFALRDFYSRIKRQTLFIISLVILSAFVLFSIYMLVYKATDIKLKGYKKNEKII